jgi:hypothetical protein
LYILLPFCFLALKVGRGSKTSFPSWKRIESNFSLISSKEGIGIISSFLRSPLSVISNLSS